MVRMRKRVLFHLKFNRSESLFTNVQQNNRYRLSMFVPRFDGDRGRLDLTRCCHEPTSSFLRTENERENETTSTKARFEINCFYLNRLEFASLNQTRIQGLLTR
jgi:hypothetical protein